MSQQCIELPRDSRLHLAIVKFYIFSYLGCSPQQEGHMCSKFLIPKLRDRKVQGSKNLAEQLGCTCWQARATPRNSWGSSSPSSRPVSQDLPAQENYKSSSKQCLIL